MLLETHLAGYQVNFSNVAQDSLVWTSQYLGQFVGICRFDGDRLEVEWTTESEQDGRGEGEIRIGMDIVYE